MIWAALLLVVALAAPAAWAWYISARELAATTETDQWRVLGLGIVVSAGVGVLILALGVVGFVLASYVWVVLAAVWSVGMLHLGLLAWGFRRASRRTGKSGAVAIADKQTGAHWPKRQQPLYLNKVMIIERGGLSGKCFRYIPVGLLAPRLAEAVGRHAGARSRHCAQLRQRRDHDLGLFRVMRALGAGDRQALRSGRADELLYQLVQWTRPGFAAWLAVDSGRLDVLRR
jgi:hypothetical protein